MNTVEKSKKLQTLPWYALHDIAVKKGIEEKEVNGKEKNTLIEKILSYGVLSDEEIEQYVNDYIYGDRVTFTLWTFQTSLKDSDHEIINSLENTEEEYLISGFRKLKILSTKEYDDRTEVVYVYSKEYGYIDEDGQNASVWEQHRGCLWIGKISTYLACISKHEKMTGFITKYIAELLQNSVTQIKPPKSAIDKCTNSKAISRIVLQGKGGEKTVVSRAGGITPEQKEEIGRIRAERIDTSGSFISAITDNIDATIKYNVRNGSIGIYKHLPASVLFEWSENAIKIILEEIEELRGKPAEEIFKEVGQEIKWTGASGLETTQLNWYLTQVISSLDKEEHEFQIPTQALSVLDNSKWFIRFPRVYCNTCDSYKIPYCTECGAELKVSKGVIKECECGAPLKIKCAEGHDSCEIVNWYIPKDLLINMINKNIQKVFKDYPLDYNICIVGDKGYIANRMENIQSEVEIPFAAIECFKHGPVALTQRVKAYAVNMNEKCGSGTCSYSKIDECIQNDEMACLPKVFYTILPGYRPQPHKGTEYGDVAAEVKVGSRAYDLKGIIKKNSENRKKMVPDDEKIRKPLLSTSGEGQEIIRQFVEQGMMDARCQIIAVVVPQHIDAGFKGTLRQLARLSGKKVTFIELDELSELISINNKIKVS